MTVNISVSNKKNTGCNKIIEKLNVRFKKIYFTKSTGLILILRRLSKNP